MWWKEHIKRKGIMTSYKSGRRYSRKGTEREREQKANMQKERMSE
jgi:hypothetical protein